MSKLDYLHTSIMSMERTNYCGLIKNIPPEFYGKPNTSSSFSTIS